MVKERIEHRKPWTFGAKFGRDLPIEIFDTYYDQRFNKDYVAYDDNGEVVAVSSNKKRLRRFLKPR